MSQHKLLQLIDQAKPNLQPLNTHYMAQFSVAERQDYATMLAAVITGTGTVTEVQSRLFGMLLTSMELENEVAFYYNLAADFSEKNVISIVENKKEVKNSLFFESFLLSYFSENGVNKELINNLYGMLCVSGIVKKYIKCIFSGYVNITSSLVSPYYNEGDIYTFAKNKKKKYFHDNNAKIISKSDFLKKFDVIIKSEYLKNKNITKLPVGYNVMDDVKVLSSVINFPVNKKYKKDIDFNFFSGSFKIECLFNFKFHLIDELIAWEDVFNKIKVIIK
ncbi:hypothetical protein GLP21_10085 [Photobacterium carnosum]|uniref:hypothetical protein n=1 Tax=Photobacterium carnosum TaxID=2023717 RepID=UPI001E3EA8E3|nr:hypothetical protein [Photobacterium carnosum]MCD9548981.1 hypothetical protein [Photobacterium carnosum]MCF2305919.1 hypothetical protein [Photobacterium carnosum]